MGRIFEFLVFLSAMASTIISMWLARHGKIPKIRRIVCLEALPELVGRAAEMGTAVHIATGMSTLESSEAPIVVAGYAMLGYVAELCGKYKVPIRYTCVYGYNIPIAQDLIKAGYLKAGEPEMYSNDMIFYAGDHQQPYSAAMMGYLLREKPAANMMFGGIKYETLNTLGAGAIAGCMQAAGTPRLYYQPFLVAACDYSMIGDELFAAAAVVRGIPEEIGVIRGQDILKAIALGLIITSAILVTIGTDLFARIIAL
jgi:hypothetical protein